MLPVVDGLAAVIEEASRRDARVVGVTGGVAVGKSTLAEHLAVALDAAVVATDGFLLDGPTLAERDLGHRKGFPESFDAAALRSFLDGWRATGTGGIRWLTLRSFLPMSSLISRSRYPIGMRPNSHNLNFNTPHAMRR